MFVWLFVACFVALSNDRDNGRERRMDQWTLRTEDERVAKSASDGRQMARAEGENAAGREEKMRRAQPGSGRRGLNKYV